MSEFSESSRRGRPEAAAVIWTWDSGQKAEDLAAKANRARRTATIRAVVGFVAAGIFFFFDRVIAAGIVTTLASLTLVLGLVSPLGAYARLDRAVVALGDAVGKVLTFLLLTPLFFGFFLPFGLLFRRGRRDPLARSYDRARPSYWEDRDHARSIDKPY